MTTDTAQLSAEKLPPLETVTIPKAALDWLMGETPDPGGLWFGDFPDDHPHPPGEFWWRTTFRDICLYYAPRMLAECPAETASRNEVLEEAAKVSERDADWTLFQRSKKPDPLTGEETNLFAISPEEMEPSAVNVMAYRLGIASGRAIAAAIRALKSPVSK